MLQGTAGFSQDPVRRDRLEMTSVAVIACDGDRFLTLANPFAAYSMSAKVAFGGPVRGRGAGRARLEAGDFVRFRSVSFQKTDLIGGKTCILKRDDFDFEKFHYHPLAEEVLLEDGEPRHRWQMFELFEGSFVERIDEGRYRACVEAIRARRFDRYGLVGPGGVLRWHRLGAITSSLGTLDEDLGLTGLAREVEDAASWGPGLAELPERISAYEDALWAAIGAAGGPFWDGRPL